tara:strand:+ start:624 stop:1031 length:408 start_codon:yes stop_codon:yes gene_type:complete
VKKKLSDVDHKVWSDYVKNPNDIFDKEKNFKKLNKRKFFRYDLHGLSLENANKKVEIIIKKCYDEGVEEILLITGKGIHSDNTDVYSSSEFSKLRNSVPDFIKNNIEVSKIIKSINVADDDQGGEGALILKLKKL